MPRGSERWVFGIGLVVAASGCASLLGDFTTNGATGGDDGGPPVDGSHFGGDGSQGDDGGTASDAFVDSPSGNDAPTGTPDAADAAPSPLTCVEQGAGAVRTKLGTIARGTSNDAQKVQLFNAMVGGQTVYRAVVPEPSTTSPDVFHVYTFGGGGGSTMATDIPIPTPTGGGQVLSVVKYPTGIGALVFAEQPEGTTSAPIVEVLKLEDGADAWSSPVIVTALGPSGCFNRVVGALAIISASAQDYVFEMAYQTCTASQTTHVAGRSTGGTVTNPGYWPLPSEAVEGADAAAGAGDAGPIVFDITGLVNAGTGIYSLTNPSGDNGPDQGVGSSTFTSTLSMTTGASSHELALISDTDIMEGLAFASVSNGNVGVALLEANLTSQSVTPVIYAGSVAGSKLATLDPATDLHALTLASIADAPINNADYHWETFLTPTVSDNLLGVGSIFPNNNGLDFVWMTADGTLRGKRTGTNAFFYDPTNTAPSILGGDITFSSAPFAAVAGFEMVFVQADGDAATTSDVWATQVNCTP